MNKQLNFGWIKLVKFIKIYNKIIFDENINKIQKNLNLIEYENFNKKNIKDKIAKSNIKFIDIFFNILDYKKN